MVDLITDFREILDPRFNRLINPDARLERLYTGCRWSEGPAYFPAGRYLIWSDIPNERMLRFDVRIDGDRTVQQGWLDVTHLLTYTNALRHAVQRHPHPEILRALYHGARFINNARTLDLEPEQRLSTRKTAAGSPQDLSTALSLHDAQAALNLLNAHLTGTDPGTLRAFCEDLALEDRLTRPIVVAHLIKTTAAAFEETRHLEDADHADAAHPLRALIRLAASPIRERRIARASHEAIRFVEQGKVPRTLT